MSDFEKVEDTRYGPRLVRRKKSSPPAKRGATRLTETANKSFSKKRNALLLSTGLGTVFLALVLGQQPDKLQEEHAAPAMDTPTPTSIFMENSTAAKPDTKQKEIKPAETQKPFSPKDHIYEMDGKRFSITDEVYNAFKTVNAKTGIPIDAMIAACGRESDCNPDSINKSSEACGLFQFMTKKPYTLYEALYKFGPEYGYKQEKSLIEKYITRRDSKGNPYYSYRPRNKDAKQKVLELCLDPTFNTSMYAAYTLPKIKKYEAWLGNRNITIGEVVAMNNLGQRGLQKFAKQAWTDKANGKDTLATDFFKKHRSLFGGDMSGNRTLLYHSDGRKKTVRESYNDIFNFGGYQEVSMIKPEKKTSPPKPQS